MPPANPPGGGGGTPQVDSSNIDDVAAKAIALYTQVQELALDFEAKTAGAKLGRDKAKAVTG